MEEDFELGSWDDMKSKDFDLLVSKERRKQVFQKIGYNVLESGEIVDQSNNEKVNDRNNKVVNLNKSPRIALVSGSHKFVKNVAEYSDVLAERGDLKFVIKKDK